MLHLQAPLVARNLIQDFVKMVSGIVMHVLAYAIRAGVNARMDLAL
jgi:hypothetical protein